MPGTVKYDNHAVDRARHLRAAVEVTRARSRVLAATARSLRSPACSAPGCCHLSSWNAHLAVRCTVGTARSVLWIPLPVRLCHGHRGTPTLVSAMRRYGALLLTDILADAGMRWPNWRRARIVYSRPAPEPDTRAA